MAEATSSTPPPPSEVWCSECEEPTEREVGRRPYCGPHADMAERVLQGVRERIEKQSTRRFEGSTFVLKAAALFAVDPATFVVRPKLTGSPDVVPGGPTPTL